MEDRPFIVDEQTHERVAVVKAYARANVFTADMLKEISIYKPETIPGNNPNFVVEIEKGYRVVYTEEERPEGLTAHISTSVDEPGSLPGIQAVAYILDVFGMATLEDSLYNGNINLETIDEDHKAISVVQLLGSLAYQEGDIPNAQ